MPTRIGLTLGPVLFHWEAAAWRDFHLRIADEAPVDTVVIGEVVCSKRMPFVAEHLPAVIDRLRAGGACARARLLRRALGGGIG